MTTQATRPPGERDEVFLELERLVKKAGLMERQPRYYAKKISGTGLAFGAGLVAFVWIGASWWNLLIAVYFAVIRTQLAFLGHDSGHQQICATLRANDRLSLVLGFLTGMSHRWWVDKHTLHHAHPNQMGKDPDIGENRFIAWTPEQLLNRGPFGHRVARWQAFLFFPLLLLEGLSLHINSFQAVFGSKLKFKSPGLRRLERSSLVLHVVLYGVAVGTVLTWQQALVFTLVDQCLWGLYMGMCFAPNHKDMEIVGADEKRNRLEAQVPTSRDIEGNWLTDLALGGLNYQITHHLFPRMARNCLRKATRIVRAYCEREEIGVKYTVTGFWRSYWIIMKYLHRVGRGVRTAEAGA